MRNRFFELLMAEMERDERIVLLFADMGRGIYEPFREKFSKRVLNIGIAEQNLIGIAAGLCSCGYKPYCYSVSNFVTERCYEQIRDDICIPGYNAVIVGTSTGFDSGTEGVSHYSLEDIGIMKTLPNMELYSPSTLLSVESCFNKIKETLNPSYVRLGKGNCDCIHPYEVDYYTIEKINKEVLLITYGNILEFCNKAAENFSFVSVMAVNQIIPLKFNKLNDEIKLYNTVIVVEEQLKNCGLYNIICEYINDGKISNTTKIISISVDNYCKEVGNKNYFADKYGYSVEKLKEKLDIIQKNQ